MDITAREFLTKGVGGKKTQDVQRKHKKERKKEKEHTNQSKQPAGSYLNHIPFVVLLIRTNTVLCV